MKWKKIFLENKIKRCFLNNVLQRFDRKDKGTTGTKDFTDCFHKQWGKFSSFMWKTLSTHTPTKENATNTTKWTKFPTQARVASTFFGSNTAKAIFELSQTPTSGGCLKALPIWKRLPTRNISVFFQLRCIMHFCLLQCHSDISILRNFWWTSKT